MEGSDDVQIPLSRVNNAWVRLKTTGYCSGPPLPPVASRERCAVTLSSLLMCSASTAVVITNLPNHFSLITLFILSPFITYVHLVETPVSTETCAHDRLTSELRSNYQVIAHYRSSPRPHYYGASMHCGFLYSTIYLFILSWIEVP